MLETVVILNNSQPGVAYKKKNVTLFYNVRNMKNIFPSWVFFLCLPCLSLRGYCQKKKVIEGGAFGKNI